MSNQETYAFRLYCRNATDRQLINIRQKERNAGRNDYAQIVNEELARRGCNLNGER